MSFAAPVCGPGPPDSGAVDRAAFTGVVPSSVSGDIGREISLKNNSSLTSKFPSPTLLYPNGFYRSPGSESRYVTGQFPDPWTLDLKLLGKFDFRIPKKKREKIEKNRKNGKKMPGLTAGPTAGRMPWPGMARTPP